MARGAMGVALLAAVAISWLTGLDYALVRLRAESPVGMAVVDGLHAYAGLVAVPLLVAKVLTARRTAAPSTQWQRGMSIALVVLLAGVFATGLAMVSPLPLPHEALAHAHLLLAVWAAAPATWHVWQQARRLSLSLPSLRAGAAAAVLLLPAGGIIAMAQPFTLPGQFGASAWRPAGLPGRYLTNVGVAADGTRVAAGDGLFVAAPGDSHWRAVGPPDLVLTVVLPSGGEPAFLGTTRALYSSPQVEGPFRRLDLPSTQVRAVVSDGATLYATSLDGVWRSANGGRTWGNVSAGLASPATAWALAVYDGALYTSDSGGIYRLTQSAWQQVLAEQRVLSLVVAGHPARLFAGSIGGGISVFDGHSWRPAVLTVGGHAEPHVNAITALADGRLVAAAMSDGVLGSVDGGLSWAQFGSGLPSETSRVAVDGDWLLAATADGVYRHPLPPAAAAGPGWWALVTAITLAAGTLAAGLLSVSPRSAAAAAAAAPAPGRRRRWRKAPGEPS